MPDAFDSSPELTFVENILERTIDIASVLVEIGMEKYIEKFEREEIDVFVFSHLKIDDLVELSIDEADHSAFARAFDSYRDIFANVDNSN